MVSFGPGRVVALAIVVGILWRIAVWRRRGGDVAREATIAVLFAWSLIVMSLTLFPLVIIFYDWKSRFNLVPFASIIQLINETSFAVAFVNIVGNVVLFVPFGVLLPLLFKRLRRPWSLLSRMIVVSLVIELVQLFTRARSVDVDDIILNLSGAAIGFGLFWIGSTIAKRSARATSIIDRLGADAEGEPLLKSTVPILVTAAIAIPFMLSAIASETIGEGQDGIVGDATAIVPGSAVVASMDRDRDRYVMVHDNGSGRHALAIYSKVLPGRFSWSLRTEPIAESGSWFTWGIRQFNVDKEDETTVYVYGVNDVGATELIVDGAAFSERIPLPDDRFFIVGFPYAPSQPSSILEEFTFRFLDGSGADISETITNLNPY